MMNILKIKAIGRICRKELELGNSTWCLQHGKSVHWVDFIETLTLPTATGTRKCFMFDWEPSTKDDKLADNARKLIDYFRFDF